MPVNNFTSNQGTQTALLTDNSGGVTGTLIPVYKLSIDGQGTFTPGNLWNGGVTGTINNGSIVVTSGTVTGGTLQNLVGGTLNSVGTVPGLGTMTNLGSITNLGQVYNAGTLAAGANIIGNIGTINSGTVVLNSGTITTGTLLSSGTTTGVGTITNLGSVTNVGQLYNAGTVQNQLAGTLTALQNGTISTGTVNLGTFVGKDANAAAQTGNPIGFGGTDSGGTIRTVLVNSSGALSVIGASAGTFVNLTTGTLNAGTINSATVSAGTVHLNGTVTDNYSGLGSFTITLGTLASSGSVGRQSTIVDNTSNLWPAALIGIQVTPGTVTAAGVVNVFLFRSDNGGGPIQDDLTGASDALGTVNNSPQIAAIPINIGTNAQYRAVVDTSDFVKRLGPKFGVIVQHALGNPFHATAGSHSITYQGINPKFS